MTHQGVVLQSVFFCFYVLLILTSKLVESTPFDGQDSDSKFKTAQDTERRTVPSSTSSIHRTNEVLKPSQIRNRRSNLLTESEQFNDDNEALDSAFLYSDQIMQNLLKNQSPKPLSYARSNFFLNLLKPRTTRYNAWDDHSLMHFGKRSVADSSGDKVLIKRSVDLWSPQGSLYFEKNPSSSTKNEHYQNERNIEMPNSVAEETNEDSWIDNSDKSSENEGINIQNVNELDKKSNDPWHSMMSFGKRSQNPWDHSTLHFGKKDDPWHNKMSFGKRFEDTWDHNTMHFGKREEPWHNMMSFGKKSDLWHSMMSFGKKSENPWDHNTLHFGKKDEPWHNMMSFGKRDEPWHNMMSFGKRDEPWHSMMSFGKRDEPWHNMMSFGKRDEPWHNMMSFGKRDEPWHNMMSFGKRDEPWHNMMSFGKKSDPWHSMMSFGKRYENPWDHNTLHFGKRDDPWHNMMSFGKRYDNPWDHNTLHFGKRDEPWHNMMSFGKRPDPSDVPELEKRDDPWHNMMSFGKRSDMFGNDSMATPDKREEPWHNMMSFGKKSDSDFGDHFTLHFGKREDPWHNMMSFGKKSEGFGFDHNTLHFGKRDEPWHNMMSFGKKSENPWDHNTLHFGKKDEPWHNMMSFGKKSENPWGEHNTLHFGKRDDPWHNMMSFGKKSDGIMADELEDIGQLPNPWEEYNGMVFYKKSDPWDHNTLHFGKKANTSSDSALYSQKPETETPKHIQKRSADMWNDHHTMHFGKKSYPWENHNTMHFGKKSENQNVEDLVTADKKFDWDSHNTMHFGKKSEPFDNHNTMHFGKKSNPWDYHNTMHFGKKRDPWDYHNTMHFGKKRDPWDYHNTMHFGKKSYSESNLKQTDASSGKAIKNEYNKDNIENEKSNAAQNKSNNKGIFGTAISEEEKELSVKKRSVTSKLKSDKIKNYAESKRLDKNYPLDSNDNHGNNNQSPVFKRSLKITEESFNKKTKKSNDDSKKSSYGFPHVVNEEQMVIPNMLSHPSGQKDYKRNETPVVAEGDTKSRINKRSVDEASFNKQNRDSSENLDPNSGLFEEYSKDDFPDTVLHFGKRSVNVLEDGGQQLENQWFNEAGEKRFDDYWDNHNTMHFGKKSDPWDSHSTLHFGKKSDPWGSHSTMHFGKRNPLDYHSTLHFGKKFDPWEGHHKMHFGKRSGDWDHSVMHFGKRDDPKDNDMETIHDAKDLLSVLLDPEQLKNLLQEKNAQQGVNDVKNKKLLEDLENLEKIINFHLRDENLPFDEKLNILKSYLKPIFKAILSGQNVVAIDDENPFLDPKEYDDGDINNKFPNEDEKGIWLQSDVIPARTIINDISYEDETLPNDSEDISEGDYIQNSKWLDHLKSFKDYKSKRTILEKPELKRYFVPFQGPKSIVYPHAWFASQIRRSALPRTTDFTRSMEMRMAEKKEDPFNSYMHFGRR